MCGWQGFSSPSLPCGLQGIPESHFKRRSPTVGLSDHSSALPWDDSHPFCVQCVAGDWGGGVAAKPQAKP